MMGKGRMNPLLGLSTHKSYKKLMERNKRINFTLLSMDPSSYVCGCVIAMLTISICIKYSFSLFCDGLYQGFMVYDIK
jgi:hypothetical protein